MARSRNRALTLEIVADPRKAQKGMKGIQGSITKFAGKMAVTAGAYFGTKAILDFGKASITAASDLEESTNAVERAMGTASASVAELGKDSASSLGLSKTALNELAVSFAAFGEKIKPGASGDAFGDIIQRATDFASVMNIDVETAMGTFQSALAGQSQPIRAYGIDLSAAAVQAYALSAGIWDGVGKITEAEKTQARYGLILQETSQYAGDFAATSDGLANSTRILAAEWTDLQAALGEALLPVAADAVNVLIAGVSDAEHYVLRMAAVAAETKSVAQSFAGGLMTVLTLGLAGDDLTESGAMAHKRAQIINSQKLYHREIGLGSTVIDAYASAQLRLIKSGESTLDSQDKLQAAVGASDVEWLDALNRLKDLAAENGIFGESLDTLNYQLLMQGQYLQPGEWEAYVEAIESGGDTVVEVAEEVSEHFKSLAEWESGEIRNEWLKLNGVLSDHILYVGDISSMWDDAIAALILYRQTGKYLPQVGVSGPTNIGGPQQQSAGPVVVNFNGVVGDPVEVGRQVQDTLTAYAGVRGI